VHFCIVIILDERPKLWKGWKGNDSLFLLYLIIYSETVNFTANVFSISISVTCCHRKMCDKEIYSFLHWIKTEGTMNGVQLFQRCLIKVLNIDLWRCYLYYIKETKANLPSFRCWCGFCALWDDLICTGWKFIGKFSCVTTTDLSFQISVPVCPIRSAHFAVLVIL